MSLHNLSELAESLPKPTPPSPFPHPYWIVFSDYGPRFPSIEEKLIQKFSQTIRSKPQWKLKYNNSDIASKWKQEFRDEFGKETRSMEGVLDYVFLELKWIDKTEATLGGFTLGPDEKILASGTGIDAVVDEKVKLQLQEQAKALAKSFDEVDYHPGTTTVVDLVHPLLFPLQYGVTPIKNEDGGVSVSEYLEEIENKKKSVSFGISKKYQWLPTSMTLDSSQDFQFTSYINNLHPVKFESLYKTISQVFNAAVPALNFSLSYYASGYRYKVEVPDGYEAYPKEYEEYMDALYNEEDKKEKEIEGYEYDYDKVEEVLSAKRLEFLKPLTVSYKEDPSPTNPINVKDFDQLKVIVKMANIELTPENPSYPGGSWHVEGTINENIVATVLYYYDVENITTSTLSFRAGFEEPRYEQGDSEYLSTYFGLKDEDVMTSPLGSTEAFEDRIIVFPNFFQHHVDPFELKDKQKPGHRKILCFFVVDPYDTLAITSDDVPPQQEEWWADEQLKDYLPDLLKEKILKLKGEKNWPQTMKEAKEMREDLMKERSVIIDDDIFDPYEREFSLCEH
ncbi:uncharacterized protein CANTADRAFT_27257 [Suhomyces tanzawaensis NRRL Y-17324]|uniref:Uncharacterized protein n=1 Tax=Suhomyces tanzawaensis NRRL Y-17324 TaxID=984487 RepID=A0A1E4SD73_9ASCO|nr:uncharacterized protein CANTADRAFT_27257 [Suhomyces tanzawaensis NRRL Y-17324]ODV77433.1 hypothetical protein CANTADRAFT_27257 [Suhomyces tanzawaensis NRRL Y-17324]